MMKPHSLLAGIVFFLSASLLAGAAIADDAQQPPPAPGRDAPIWEKGPKQNPVTTPAIEKIGPGILRIGKVIVNKPEGFVEVPGKVNMQEGLIEYLACSPYGKLHESVLMLDVDPYALKIAMLLMGLEPGNKPIAHQGASETPEGDPVEIWISWQNEKKQPVDHRAEDLILDTKTGKPMPHTVWVFTGSQIQNGRFMAQVEHSIAATYHDPFALLDHTLPTGADDTLYHANSAVVPPKGTAVSFRIKPLEKTK